MSFPKIEIIEGNISSGKSTLSENYCNYLISSGQKVHLAEEFVNGDFLGAFYKDRLTYGFAFQMYMQSTRLFQIESSKLYQRLGENVIIDRGSFGDFVFAFLNYLDGKISEKDFVIYLSVCRQRNFFEHFDFIDSITYLNVSPKECFRRKSIREKERSAEKIVPLEYLVQVQQIYFHTLLRVAERYPGKVKFMNWEAYGSVSDYFSAQESRVSFVPKSGYIEVDLFSYRESPPDWFVKDYPLILDFDEPWYWVGQHGIDEVFGLLQNGKNVYVKY